MKIVQVTQAPPFHREVHPEPMVQALVGISFDLSFEQIDVVFWRQPKLKRPPTNYLPVPLNTIIEALCQQDKLKAAKYWLEEAQSPFLAIPVQCCSFDAGAR